MAKAERENFPVAARFLPRQVRTDLLAVYGFARLVDDVGDESSGDRGIALDRIESELNRVFAGDSTHPLMRRLIPAVRAHAIPPEPFQELIAANRQDQVIARYPTFEDLLGYCELSANPVGRLVLYVFDAATPDRIRLSNWICTGLQLVEHWQDVSEDYARGRVYLPGEDLIRFGVAEEELRAGPASLAFRRMMSFEVNRARGLLDRGTPLCRRLPPRAGLAVAAFVAGGISALDAIARAGFDVLGARPRPSDLSRVLALVRTLALSYREG